MFSSDTTFFINFFGNRFYLCLNKQTTVNMFLFYNLTKSFCKTMVKMFVASKMFPEFCTAVYRIGCIYGFIVCREILTITIQYTNYQIVISNT